MEPEEEPSMAAVREVCEEVCTKKKEHGVSCDREPVCLINTLMIIEIRHLTVTMCLLD